MNWPLIKMLALNIYVVCGFIWIIFAIKRICTEGELSIGDLFMLFIMFFISPIAIGLIVFCWVDDNKSNMLWSKKRKDAQMAMNNASSQVTPMSDSPDAEAPQEHPDEMALVFTESDGMGSPPSP